MNTRGMTVAGVAAILLAAGGATAEVSIETVPIGNPGNADDTHGDGYGGVGYTYNIATCEVSNAQYCEFLNAVAAIGDPHKLYDMDMGGGWNDMGGISRSGSGTAADPWAYSPRPNRGNRPVNRISWGDAARFANWLQNGQPAGAQDLTTTEDGAYFLNGAMSKDNLMAVVRKVNWKWAIPTEDEWYKAAYYDGGSGVYYDYPTGSDTAPTPELPPGSDMTNGSANYDDYVDTTHYTTECGAYTRKPSASPYGTFDQGGNVWEWNEAVVSTSFRGNRGGGFGWGENALRAAIRGSAPPTYNGYGFRLVQVPEPATLSLLVLGGLAVLRRRPRRRAAR